MSNKNAKVQTISGKVDAKEWVKAHNGYPEKGIFVDEKSIQKFYKQLDEAQLVEWCAVEGLEYKPCAESQPINRMRMCMAILYYHFPKQNSGSSKTKSKYADMTTESLVALAVEHEVAFELCDDARILRMRAIMALRAAKVIE